MYFVKTCHGNAVTDFAIPGKLITKSQCHLQPAPLSSLDKMKNQPLSALISFTQGLHRCLRHRCPQ